MTDLMNARKAQAAAEDVVAAREAAREAAEKQAHDERVEAMTASTARHIADAVKNGDFSVTLGCPFDLSGIPDLIDRLRGAGYVVECLDPGGRVIDGPEAITGKQYPDVFQQFFAGRAGRMSLRISWGATEDAGDAS